MMKKTRWISGLYRQLSTPPVVRHIAGGLAVTALMAVTGIAMAQTNMAGTQYGQPTAPSGYALHESINLGGHMANITGSHAMYNTLVNLHSGPRVLGDQFTLTPLKTNKHPLFDHMTAFSNGFGGDPFNFVRMDVEKGDLYQFTGTFRRDRRYFDYDLLGNPDIPSGRSVPIGPVDNPTGELAWPQVRNSPFMYNTVRRMTNVSLTLLPVSRVTYHFEYGQNVFEGPSLSPGAGSPYFAPGLGASNQLLEAYQRNSVDEFIGSVSWKPVRGTKLTFEEIVDHNKIDTFYTIAPGQFMVQESDGTPASLGDWDSLTPYGIGSCNTGSMSAPFTILSPAQTPGGKPVINPACDVVTNYLRSQPTRILYPTEIFRFSTTSIKHLAMNGDVRYTDANMNLPHYFEHFQGLSGTTRAITYTGNASAKRKVIAIDYGATWQMAPDWSIADQLTYSNVQQPGVADINSATAWKTPGNPNETITYTGPLTASGVSAGEGAADGTPNFFGQKRFVNRVTATWSGSAATVSLTYRYRYHLIAQGNPHNAPLAVGSTTDGTVTINQNGGILTVDVNPTLHWNVDGSAAIFYSDNAFTPVEPRQMQRYRIHTMFHPKSWLAITAAYNDREIHNNTNNNQAAVAAGKATYDGPIDHVAYSRVLGLGATVTPNAYYSVSMNYGFSDVYASTNICYDAAASPADPGAATPSGTACPGATVRAAPYYEMGPTKDFMHAPTQYGTVALNLNPSKRLRSTLGYNISSVSGSRFYNEARDVAGSLISTYQSPYVKLSWTVRKGLIWNAEYNYYGYGEGGPSGAKYCTTSTTLPTPGNPAPVVPCDSPSMVGLQTGRLNSPTGPTAPRIFHANIVTLGMHYEF